MVGEKMFEFFDAEKMKLTVKEDWSKEASKFEIQDASEYEKLLDDFAKSDKDKTGVWYYGDSSHLPSVAVALEKYAEKKGYHISVAVAKTEDGKDALLLMQLNEAEYKKLHGG